MKLSKRAKALLLKSMLGASVLTAGGCANQSNLTQTEPNTIVSSSDLPNDLEDNNLDLSEELSSCIEGSTELLTAEQLEILSEIFEQVKNNGYQSENGQASFYVHEEGTLTIAISNAVLPGNDLIKKLDQLNKSVSTEALVAELIVEECYLQNFNFQIRNTYFPLYVGSFCNCDGELNVDGLGAMNLLVVGNKAPALKTDDYLNNIVSLGLSNYDPNLPTIIDNNNYYHSTIDSASKDESGNLCYIPFEIVYYPGNNYDYAGVLSFHGENVSFEYIDSNYEEEFRDFSKKVIENCHLNLPTANKLPENHQYTKVLKRTKNSSNI